MKSIKILLSIIRLIIEPPIDVVGLDNVHKGLRVHPVNHGHQPLCFLPGYHGVKHGEIPLGVAAGSLKAGGAVVGEVADTLVHLLRLACDDEQSVLLVPLVKHLNHLSGGELEDDGVERRVPAEEHACRRQHQGVGPQNVVPDILTVLFRKVDGKDIGAAAAGVAHQAEGDGAAVDQAAENTDQQRIIGDGLGGDQVREHTGEKDHTAGADGKFFPHVAESHVDGEGVQQQVDHREGHGDVPEFFKDPLDEQGQTVEASGKHGARPDKGFDVDGDDHRGQRGAAEPLNFMGPDYWMF